MNLMLPYLTLVQSLNINAINLSSQLSTVQKALVYYRTWHRSTVLELTLLDGSKVLFVQGMTSVLRARFSYPVGLVGMWADARAKHRGHRELRTNS